MRISLIVLHAVLLLAGSSAQAAAMRYSLDPDHTLVAFLVEHVGYADTLGRFTEVSGDFTYDVETGELSDVLIVVQTASIETDHEARDKHVRGKDFLDVQAHPEMRFTARQIQWSRQGPDGGEGQLEGDLQLLGMSRPVTLSVTLNKAAEYPFGHKRFTLGVSARGELNRSEFGMNYGVAGALVGDEVELLIETEAIAQDN